MHEDGLANIKPTAATLTDEKHRVGPHNEVWEVQPLYDVVIEVGTLESPWVICREGGAKSISFFAALCPLCPMQGWIIRAAAPGRPRTSAGRRGDADADEVLERDDARQEAAVLGPDLRDGFSSASIQDSNQPAGMNHGIEIHSLTDYVN